VPAGEDMDRNPGPTKRYARQGGAIRPAILILLIFLSGLAIDALFIEPYWIQVDHSTVVAPVAAPLKIAHLSDLHTRGVGRRERKLLAILDEEKPDLIVITGDSLASWGGSYGRCRELYQKLHAPLGVWFVRGNWENMRPVRHEHDYYEKAGVHLLLNGNQRVRSDVWLAGLDDPSSGTPKLDAALDGIPTGAYTILLFHAPAFFDRAAGRVNLCLTGHTHGGQVRLPFLPPLWLPSECGRFLEGWYEEKGSRMFVSRGVGMSVLPVRFRCRPEISFITLEPER
jgi:predicted MPP superfamily phosphohydrolase